jgi:uncharacterized membrane protein YbhN (UPF0104 family)
MKTGAIETEVNWQLSERRHGRAVILAMKLAVTMACFWYLGSRVDLAKALEAAENMTFGWFALAVLALMLHLPLVCLRWCKIVDALARDGETVARFRMLVITAVISFFAQVMPSIASEGFRAWMLVRLGPTWRRALISVLMDRGIGVGAFAAASVIILLIPSPLAAALPQRGLLAVSFKAIVLAGAIGLAAAPHLAPLLERWPYTAWAGNLARAAQNVMLRSSAGLWSGLIAGAIELLAIVSIWFVGCSLDLGLTIVDAAVLFTVIFGSALIPISIAGWGIRELAVAAVLGTQGVPLEQSLIFSVCFGLALLAASLPGAVVWTVHSPMRLNQLRVARS